MQPSRLITKTELRLPSPESRV